MDLSSLMEQKMPGYPLTTPCSQQAREIIRTVMLHLAYMGLTLQVLLIKI